MQIKFTLDEGAYKPEKAHALDAGFDLRAREKQTVVESNVFDTGVHVEIPKGYVGYVQGRSGLNINNSIVCPTGTIDAGFTGSIKVKLYNLEPWNSFARYVRTIEPGDKIAQLIIQPLADCELIEADTLEDTERGNNGFGSTGR